LFQSMRMGTDAGGAGIGGERDCKPSRHGGYLKDS
jgi:hypothetical protein